MKRVTLERAPLSGSSCLGTDFPTVSKTLTEFGFVIVYELCRSPSGTSYFWFSPERQLLIETRLSSTAISLTAHMQLQAWDAGVMFEISGFRSPHILPDGDCVFRCSTSDTTSIRAILTEHQKQFGARWIVPQAITHDEIIDPVIAKQTGLPIQSSVCQDSGATIRSYPHRLPEAPPEERLLASGKKIERLPDGYWRTKGITTRYWWTFPPPFDDVLMSAYSPSSAKKLREETGTLLNAIAQFEPYSLERNNTEYLDTKKLCFSANWQGEDRALLVKMHEGKPAVWDYCNRKGAPLWTA